MSIFRVKEVVTVICCSHVLSFQFLFHDMIVIAILVWHYVGHGLNGMTRRGLRVIVSVIIARVDKFPTPSVA